MNKSDFNPEDYTGYLFDMDGVLTQTAKLHASCWKTMFDEFLQDYAQRKSVPFEPFDVQSDYKQYVDGKPRYEGVKSFLGSRNIELPETDDGTGPSVRGLGDRKNELINDVLKSEGVDIYEGTIRFVKYLRERGKKIAVVSSSNNCQAILEAGGISELFDTRVDGKIASEMKLAGKPAPDMFSTAAKNLNITNDQCVVIEDAISGVQAGAAGKFGVVVGVNHDGDYETLKQHGADFVLSDLGELIR